MLPSHASTAMAVNAARPVRAALGAHALRFVALSAVLLITACSSIRLGYNNADTLLVYALDSYLDLDDRQSQLAKERLRNLMAWHRATQLSGYAQLVEDAQRKVGANGTQVSADDILALQRDMNSRLVVFGEQAAPDLAQLLTTLTPAQIDRFAGKLATDTSKARREMLKIAGRETPEDRVKRYAERAESWLGSVSRAQFDLLRASLADRPDGGAQWMAERERRQNNLVALMRRALDERAAVDRVAGWLREYFADMADPADAAQRAAVHAWRRANAELMAQLVNSASADQRAALNRKLRGYAQDFSSLAAEAVTSGRS